MEKISSNSVYDFNPNQLQEVRARNGYENAKQMSQALDTLEDWIKKQNHFAVKDFDRGYLELLIAFNKGSIERTKQRLDKTCTLRHLMPEFLCNIDVENEFQQYRDIVRFCLFPEPTKDHYRIAHISFIKADENFDIMKHFRYVSLVYQYALFNDYIMGIEIIVDLRLFTYGMMRSLNIADTQKGFLMLLQIFGSRIKAIHVIFASKVVDGLLTLVKSCLTDKLKKRLLIHSSYDSICDIIDKSILPEEIGGEYKRTTKELSDRRYLTPEPKVRAINMLFEAFFITALDELFKELCSESHRARIKHLDKAVTIESRRLGTSFNEEYSGMPGSFKTLCVD